MSYSRVLSGILDWEEWVRGAIHSLLLTPAGSNAQGLLFKFLLPPDRPTSGGPPDTKIHTLVCVTQIHLEGGRGWVSGRGEVEKK